MPLVLNAGFNEHEAIVANPTKALNLYLRTRMDVLALQELGPGEELVLATTLHR